MAPVNQLGVLAFASAVLAVPHAQFQPFKRHAHPGAPPAYDSSYGSSSAPAEPASSADPWSGSSAPAYPSGSSAAAVSGSSWSAPAYPSGSSVAAVSGSSWVSAPPYPSASRSSGWANPTGYGSYSSAWGTGYSSYASGYSSGSVSYSTCTETDTLIYRSTTAYSTYVITHTIYEHSSAASVAPVSDGPGGYSSGDPSWGASSAAPVYSSPASPVGADVCVPDVTVTETVQTTITVTPGAPAGYSSSAAAPSYGGGSWGAPAASSAAAASDGGWSSAAAAPSYPAAPSSAAAPSYSAPASGGAGGILGKRGLAYNDASLANVFGGGKAGGWGYNWISSSDGLDSSIPYIPMLHDASSDFTGSWAADAKAGIAAGAQYLFSFNEPDLSTQANLTPEEAAAAWKTYMEPFAGQAKLVAPSVTNGQGDDIGLGWLTQFLSACSDCTIDSVALHWYYPGNPIDTFKEQISAVTSATGKSVWLNEFGADGTDDEKSAFLSEVLPWLDSNASVLGYSYFMVSDGLLISGDAPSSYGQTYAA